MRAARTVDARAVERRAILVLAVAIPVVSAPHWSMRRLDLEQRVDSADRVHDACVVWRTQAESDKRQHVGADDLVRRLVIVRPRPIPDGHKAALR